MIRNESSGTRPACIPRNQANYALRPPPIRFSSVTRFCEVKAQS